jgi:hypothetical protein
MKPRPVPNPQLLSALYNRYYLDSDSECGHTSSHWKFFTGKATVALDGDGVPRPLRGSGFGDLDRKAGVLDWLGVAAIRYSSDTPSLAAAQISRATALAAQMGLAFTQDALRQVFTLSFLQERKVLSSGFSGSVCIVGDGFGFLASLIRMEYPSARIALVDLGRTLLFQAYYVQLAHPNARHALLGHEDVSQADFEYCAAEHLEDVHGSFDVVINVASMQEMNSGSVARYFAFFSERRIQWFYCCNRESKALPGGEVSRFLSYPWLPEDRHLVDEPCPWHQWFVGRASRGPRVLGVRIPLLSYYDGVHRHRLTQLAWPDAT